MFKDFYRKKVIVYLKNGEIIKGYFSDVSSEYDNDGPATVIIDKWEIEEQEIEKMELNTESKSN